MLNNQKASTTKLASLDNLNSLMRLQSSTKGGAMMHNKRHLLHGNSFLERKRRHEPVSTMVVHVQRELRQMPPSTQSLLRYGEA